VPLELPPAFLKHLQLGLGAALAHVEFIRNAEIGAQPGQAGGRFR